jgi:hypothetical protein
MIITIPDKWQPFVRSLVESGRVASAEAVITEARRRSQVGRLFRLR